jgi:hypothetical protein
MLPPFSALKYWLLATNPHGNFTEKNIIRVLTDFMAQHSRRQPSSYSPL